MEKELVKIWVKSKLEDEATKAGIRDVNRSDLCIGSAQSWVSPDQNFSKEVVWLGFGFD